MVDTQVLFLVGKTAFRICYLTGMAFWSIVIIEGLYLMGKKVFKK